MAIAQVLEDSGNVSALLNGVTKSANIRLADVLDGRLFLVVLAKSLSGGMKLAPDLSGAAQKLLTAACPGASQVAGKKPASVSGVTRRPAQI